MEMPSSVVDPQQQPQRGTNTGNGSVAATSSVLNTPVDGAGDGMMSMGMMGDDSPVSHNDEDLSDGDVDRDDPDSCDELRHHRAASILADHGDVLAKLKMQVRDIKEDYDSGPRTHLNTLTSTSGVHFNPRNTVSSLSPSSSSSLPPNFQLPMPFPFPHPAAAAAAAAAAFLPPLAAAAAVASHHHHSSMAAAAAVAAATAAAHGSGSGAGAVGGGPHQQQQGSGGGAPSSGSSHSSEGSVSSQHTWSFEEQFKQVRQLYEINDDPKRKEFLDDLFSFMQKRGTPINRLPIMAKSVLDLYELYNLVIARGGLVDVINKKLWQEIIKGLHLPSSITSAAFTLRTQYMKYLYPFECEKRRLSTPAELQAAIDGNRREGRRSSYGQYEAGGLTGGPCGGMGGGPGGMLQQQRSPNPAQMSPLASLQQQQQHLAARMGLQGMGLHNGAHHPSHPTPLGVQPLNGGPLPGLAPSEFEARMLEYVKLLNKEIRSTAAAAATTPPPSRGSAMGVSSGEQSPPGGATSPTTAHLLTPLEMSRMTLWNLYNNNHTPLLLDSQPQKEALNLADAANAVLTSHHHHQQQQQQQQQQQHMVNLIKREMDSSKASARVTEEDDGEDDEDITPPPTKRFMMGNSHHHAVDEDEDMDDDEDTDRKPPMSDMGRSKTDSNKGAVGSGSTGGPSTNIKITSRGDVRTGDSSLVVSMELNGVTYQGVLFAQQQTVNSHQPQTARTAITL